MQWGAGWCRNVAQASRRAGFAREAASLDLEVAAPDFSKLAVQLSCPTHLVGHLLPSSHSARNGAAQPGGGVLLPPSTSPRAVSDSPPHLPGVSFTLSPPQSSEPSSWRARI